MARTVSNAALMVRIAELEAMVAKLIEKSEKLVELTAETEAPAPVAVPTLVVQAKATCVVEGCEAQRRSNAPTATYCAEHSNWGQWVYQNHRHNYRAFKDAMVSGVKGDALRAIATAPRQEQPAPAAEAARPVIDNPFAELPAEVAAF